MPPPDHPDQLPSAPGMTPEDTADELVRLYRAGYTEAEARAQLGLDQPGQLEASDSPSAALEADLSTVDDAEFFAAVDATSTLQGIDQDGNVVHPHADVMDLREMSPTAQAFARAELDRQDR